MRPLPPFARPCLLVAAALFALAACDREAKPPPAAPPATEAESLPPAPQPVVDRAELLLALDAAASAFAVGQTDGGPGLTGRRFTVRQAFGCVGPAAGAVPAGLASWTWGTDNRTIELALQPADWTADVMSGHAENAEAVEGFWLARPWMRVDSCPAVSAPDPSPMPEAPVPSSTAPPMAPRQTVGLAAVFDQGGSRVGRRDGRAFKHTIRGDGGPPAAPSGGYRLVIEGRFTTFPGGRTIRCRTGGPDERPACFAASTIDRVIFESAEGEMLSEWRSG